MTVHPRITIIFHNIQSIFSISQLPQKSLLLLLLVSSIKILFALIHCYINSDLICLIIFSTNPLVYNPGFTLTIGESNGTPLQYSCQANPMDGGAW